MIATPCEVSPARRVGSSPHVLDRRHLNVQTGAKPVCSSMSKRLVANGSVPSGDSIERCPRLVRAEMSSTSRESRVASVPRIPSASRHQAILVNDATKPVGSHNPADTRCRSHFGRVGAENGSRHRRPRRRPSRPISDWYPARARVSHGPSHRPHPDSELLEDDRG